jgi:DNA polymerase-3 subunit epsilon
MSSRKKVEPTPVDFVAIDVETANADLASICQIGVAAYAASSLVDEWKTYVDPQDFFDPLNISIHGITEETVADAPTLPGIAEPLLLRLKDCIVLCHTHFDRVALHQAFNKYGLEPPECVWLDSARVARRTWKQFANCGYGLQNLCDHIGYEFAHHDALEDAKAAAQILLAAMQATGLNVDDWLRRVAEPINPRVWTAQPPIRREGNPEGPLFGEVMVFTGALQMPRHEAADLAASVGCEVFDYVSKATTTLVVGDQDVRKLAGHEKSAKHRKAEEFIDAGHPLRILRESDFLELVRIESTPHS